MLMWVFQKLIKKNNKNDLFTGKNLYLDQKWLMALHNKKQALAFNTINVLLRWIYLHVPQSLYRWDKFHNGINKCGSMCGAWRISQKSAARGAE